MGFRYILKYEQGGKGKKAIGWEKNKIEKVSAERNMPFHNFLFAVENCVYSFFFQNQGTEYIYLVFSFYQLLWMWDMLKHNFWRVTWNVS